MSGKKTTTLFHISIGKGLRTTRQWQAGQQFALIPKGTGVLLVPIRSREDLAGIARGANPEDYRDRTDRV